MAWNRFRRCGTKSARFKKTHSASAKYMGLLEASKDNRNAQRDGSDAVYAPLHPLTFSWEVPRHHDTLEKVISKGDTNFFFCFVSLSWFWLNIMAVLADNHSGNEPGRRTTKVFITFVVTPALHIISVINFPSTFNSQANAAEFQLNLNGEGFDERTWNNKRATWSNSWHVLLSQVCFCCGGLILPYAFSLQLTP